MRGLWICPKCLKDFEGFQRFNKCPDCKTRLRFTVGESKTNLTTCEKCQNLFDFSKQKEVAPGAVKCPKCGAVVNQKGHLAGKQEASKLNETVDVREWQWHCSRCHSIHTGTESQSACPKCGSELTFGTIPGSHESASGSRMLCEGFHVQRLPGGGWRLWEKLSPAKQKEYDAETAKIKANKETPEAQKPHKFQRAKWTFGNGHPRCLLCGSEEPIYDECCGLAMEKDPKAVQAFYDKLTAERGSKGLMPKEEFDSKKFRSFKGAKWTAPNSDSKCRLCGNCGACGKDKPEIDKAVRTYVLDYFARLHG